MTPNRGWIAVATDVPSRALAFGLAHALTRGRARRHPRCVVNRHGGGDQARGEGPEGAELGAVGGRRWKCVVREEPSNLSKCSQGSHLDIGNQAVEGGWCDLSRRDAEAAEAFFHSVFICIPVSGWFEP